MTDHSDTLAKAQAKADEREVPAGVDLEQDRTRCKRCKRETTEDFRSDLCYACERALFGEE